MDLVDHHSNTDRITTIHVRRAMDGNRESLSWITERFSSLLYFQAFRRLGRLKNAIDPDDLVNETWLVALPRLAELSPREGRHTPVILKFLSTTMTHLINRHIEKHIRRRKLAPEAPRADDASRADPLGEVSDGSTLIISRVARGERRSLLMEAIAALDPLDQEIVVLRGMEQVSNKVAAELLGQDPGTVAVRFHRALERLRKKVPGSVFDEL